MAELKQDPSQALLSLLYPLLGGEANVASITRRGNRISAQLKDESLADAKSAAQEIFDDASEKEHDPLFPVHQPKGMGLCAG